MYYSSNSAIKRNIQEAGITLESDDADIKSLPIEEITIHTPTKVARHPVESGSVIMDNKVKQPTEINAECLLYVAEYHSQIERLGAALDDKSDFTYSIKTKTDTFDNLILEDMTEKQVKGKYDVVHISLKFVEMMAIDVNVRQSAGSARKRPNAKPPKTSNRQNSEKKWSGQARKVTGAGLALTGLLMLNPVLLTAGVYMAAKGK